MEIMLFVLFQVKNYAPKPKLLECGPARAYYSPVEVNERFKNKKK